MIIQIVRDGEVIKGEWGDCDLQNIICRLIYNDVEKKIYIYF